MHSLELSDTLETYYDGREPFAPLPPVHGAESGAERMTRRQHDPMPAKIPANANRPRGSERMD